MSMTNAFDKFMNKNEPDHNKRNTMTGSLKHRDNRSLSLSIFALMQPNLISTKCRKIQRILKAKKQRNANKLIRSLIRVR